jgi:hypothetical protein
MKKINFSFFSKGKNKGTDIKRSAYALRAGRFNFYAQATLEYFVLFAVFTTICLLSAGKIFGWARVWAEILYDRMMLY